MGVNNLCSGIRIIRRIRANKRVWLSPKRAVDAVGRREASVRVDGQGTSFVSRCSTDVDPHVIATTFGIVLGLMRRACD